MRKAAVPHPGSCFCSPCRGWSQVQSVASAESRAPASPVQLPTARSASAAKQKALRRREQKFPNINVTMQENIPVLPQIGRGDAWPYCPPTGFDVVIGHGFPISRSQLQRCIRNFPRTEFIVNTAKVAGTPPTLASFDTTVGEMLAITVAMFAAMVTKRPASFGHVWRHSSPGNSGVSTRASSAAPSASNPNVQDAFRLRGGRSATGGRKGKRKSRSA